MEGVQAGAALSAEEECLMTFGAFLREKRETGGRNGARISRRQLAADSGVSIGYLARLEQGLSSNPSVAVLDRLARALDLKGSALKRFYGLATDTNTVVYGQARRAVTDDQRAYVDALNPNPAALVSHEWDVLYGNESYFAAFPGLREACNVLIWFFLFSASKQVMVEWEHEAGLTVAWLHGLMAESDVSERVQEIYNLCSGSDDFLRMWESPATADDRQKPVMKVCDRGSGGQTDLAVRLWTPPGRCSDHFLFLAVPTPSREA